MSISNSNFAGYAGSKNLKYGFLSLHYHLEVPPPKKNSLKLNFMMGYCAFAKVMKVMTTATFGRIYEVEYEGAVRPNFWPDQQVGSVVGLELDFLHFLN